MKLIIEIPEDVFKRTVFYREFRDLNDCVTTIKALEKAIPLPKGHGDLIDSNVLCEQYEKTNGDLYQALDLTQTIIEADKGE